MHRLLLVGFTYAFLCLCTANTQAQNIQSSIDALVNNTALKNASISIHVLDLSNNKILGKYDENKSLIPASSLKLITTGVALDKLGADFRYSTKLLSANGNIYILGSGDPTLGAPKSDYTLNTKSIIDKFSQVVSNAGIGSLSGGIISISNVFDSQPVGDSWPWYDLGNYYAGGVWGLNIRENYYDLFLDQNPSPGKAPQCCGTDPEIKGLAFINELTSGSKNSGDNAYIYGAPYDYKKFIRGSIPSGNGTFKIKGSVPEPPLLTAQLLDSALREKNIIPAKQPTYSFQTPNLNQATELFSHQSPKLNDIIKETNQKSINLYAEALLKTIGHYESREPGSFQNGIESIYSHLQSNGINTEGLYMVDGSGMSPRNGISSRHFTDFLAHVYSKANLYPKYKESLAIIGREGTLQYLMKSHPIAGHLYGKSGSMERVRSYTGYVDSQSGKTIAFSIIINNYAGKSRPVVRLIEQIFAEMYAL